MNISKILKIGLVSAFSISVSIMTSCDSGGDGGGGLTIFPEELQDGDTIIIRGFEGPTMNIIDRTNLSFISPTETLPATYDYVDSGSYYRMDLDFNLKLEGQPAIIRLNQAIADPNSSINDLIFSGNPTNAELNFFIKAVEDANIEVTLSFDRDFNLFIQDSFKLYLPKSGKGTVEKILSGQGIELILGNGGKLAAIQADGSERNIRIEFQKDEGVRYLPAR